MRGDCRVCVRVNFRVACRRSFSQHSSDASAPYRYLATRIAQYGLQLRLLRLALRTLMNIHRQRVPAAAQSIG